MILVGLRLGWLPFFRSLLVLFQIGENVANERMILVQLVAVGLLDCFGGMLLVSVLDKDVTLQQCMSFDG